MYLHRDCCQNLERQRPVALVPPLFAVLTPREATHGGKTFSGTKGGNSRGVKPGSFCARFFSLGAPLKW